MAKLYLLTGSNRDDRMDYLRKAFRNIREQIGNIICSSSVYETEPFGFKDECLFLNQCLLVDTTLSPEDVLNKIGQIENSLGRIRRSGIYEGRTIDIDILFYGNLVIHMAGLIIPHPELHKRNFALVPMSEISPGYVHPVLRKKMKTLLRNSDDTHKVFKYSDTLF
jgi:2-amino-4-hydroxy-6-hydroxymethyldihydropteridine diphosphokinase